MKRLHIVWVGLCVLLLSGCIQEKMYLQLNEDGLSELLTMISPVQHSQVIQIDGDNYFVERVNYRWNNGGRTLLGIHPC